MWWNVHFCAAVGDKWTSNAAHDLAPQLQRTLSILREPERSEGVSKDGHTQLHPVYDHQIPVRMTWMFRSLIFLRSVLRLTPSRSAARI